MPLSAPELHEAVLEATNALNDATRTLEETKRAHRNQILIVAVAVAMLGLLFYFGYRESKENARENCGAIATGRSDLTQVLEIIVDARREERTPDEQARTDALFQKIIDEALPPIDCSNI